MSELPLVRVVCFRGHTLRRVAEYALIGAVWVPRRDSSATKHVETGDERTALRCSSCGLRVPIRHERLSAALDEAHAADAAGVVLKDLQSPQLTGESDRHAVATSATAEDPELPDTSGISPRFR